MATLSTGGIAAELPTFASSSSSKKGSVSIHVGWNGGTQSGFAMLSSVVEVVADYYAEPSGLQSLR